MVNTMILVTTNGKEVVMPWAEVSLMVLREEFVQLAGVEGANVRALCRRFGISPPTAYKWLRRFKQAGLAGLQEHTRRPHDTPTRTMAAMEALVLALRDDHPAWGGRKLAARLEAPGHRAVPCPSTITRILQRHGRISPAESAKRQAWQRFERAAPNELWQMDFKGHVALGQGQGRVHPLTILDDHSRFALGLEACANERTLTVTQRLTQVFQRYGLPDRLVMDHGAPWGAPWSQPYTPLTVWLLRLGVGVSHGRPYHPQTQGKDERFHRTLKAELLHGRVFADLAQAQTAFDRWRASYNAERPHEALGLLPPASRYRISDRAFPVHLPTLEYGPDDLVRRVQDQGLIHLHGRTYRISEAFRGHPVGLRPTAQDGLWDVYFARFRVGQLDQRQGPERTPSPRYRC